MKRAGIFYLLGIFLFLLAPEAQAQETVVITDENELTDIGKSIAFLNDREGKLDFETIRQAPYTEQFILNTAEPFNTDLGFESVWVRFTLQNKTGKELFLKMENGGIPEIGIYSPQADGSFSLRKMGTLHPENKKLKSRYLIFSVSEGQNPEPETIYIRIRQKIHHEIPLHISAVQHLTADSMETDIFFGIFFGTLLIMFVYNLYIFIVLREIGYLYYSIHILIDILFSLFISGYGSLFFWPNSPKIHLIFGTYTTFAGLFILIPFAAEFLETKKRLPNWHKGLWVFVCILIPALVLSFFKMNLSLSLTQVILLILFIYIVLAGISSYRKGNKIARFYILGNLFYLVGMLILFLKFGKMVPINWFTVHAIYLGIALEVLFVSFALADKIRYINQDRIRVQNENIRLVEEQKVELESKVRERTSDLESASAEIMAQNEELNQQHEELTAINENLETKNQTIIENKKTIEDAYKMLSTTSNRLNASLRYANDIQQIILPKTQETARFFRDSFVIYKPKDVVSGDFYWFVQPDERTAVFALSDCTGHGVPGAFMSMVGSTLLNESVRLRGMVNPAKILQNLAVGVQNTLKQVESKNRDGMDIALCLFEKQADEKNTKITFSGAKSNVYYIKDRELVRLSGDRISIGGSRKQSANFTNQTITLAENDLIYFSTDGYTDQNNSNRKRLGSEKLQHLLQEISRLNLSEQKEKLLESLAAHQQEEEQRDDISVVGLQL